MAAKKTTKKKAARQKKPAPDADALLEHMAGAAEKFDVGKVKEGQLAKAAGAGD